jgi:CheY-like chemotaxis protein/HPt (histidine-containing phosphotransfer) domain-containing protein
VEHVRAIHEATDGPNRIRGELWANVGHELRTPMYGIAGMTELALGEELSPLVRDYLETARCSAEILMTLVNEILDFSTLPSGTFELQIAPFRLRPLLDEVIRELATATVEKGSTMARDVAEGVPDALFGDATRLRQILLQLLSNAVKFSERGAVVLRVLAEYESEREVSLRFEVSDAGIGIARADHDRIFAPFTQVDSSRTRRHGGAGLGLTIAGKLVQIMGGHIAVQSTLGRGSTFAFTITLSKKLGGALDETHASAAALAKTAGALRILLAEDTVASQKIVKNVLIKRGHEVEIARDGSEVVEMIRVRPFDVVLMDVQMPAMDGLQATAAIRSLESHRDQRVPIIAITAHAMQGDRERCLAAGRDAYLCKPFHGAELVELVETLAAGASSNPPPSGTRVAGASAPSDDPSLPADRPVFGMEASLARLGNDRVFFGHLVAFVLEDYPALLAQLAKGLQDRDGSAVGHAAHNLKGLLSTFDAFDAMRAAARVEKAGFDGDLETAQALAQPLDHEIRRLRDALLPYRVKPD